VDPRGRAYRVENVAGRDVEGRLTASLRPLDPGRPSYAGLTPREMQVARLLACRATNAEVASALCISDHTARNHSRRVLEKLGITSKVKVREHLADPRTSANDVEASHSEGLGSKAVKSRGKMTKN
jgi:DNA-binding NarL/FixJ family response regulator